MKGVGRRAARPPRRRKEWPGHAPAMTRAATRRPPGAGRSASCHGQNDIGRRAATSPWSWPGLTRPSLPCRCREGWPAQGGRDGSAATGRNTTCRTCCHWRKSRYRLKARGDTIAIAKSSTGRADLGSAAVGGRRVGVFPRRQCDLHAVHAFRICWTFLIRCRTACAHRPSPTRRCLQRPVRGRLGSTWGLSETGATGPTGNRYGDAAGHTCIGLEGPQFSRAITLETGSADRVANMRAFAKRALDLLAGSARLIADD